MCLFVRIPVSSVSVFVCSSLCVCVYLHVYLRTALMETMETQGVGSARSLCTWFEAA